jgi:hypothetical protein
VKQLSKLAFFASLITASGAASGLAFAQTYVSQPVVVPQPAPTEDIPLLSADQLDQLLAPIALYPDPLIAQILPASTYPIDIVKAARLVRSGASPDQIDQQDWDPSVKAVAHESSVIEMMDQSLDWTQQLGQAFIAQPDDVMQSIQRLRVQAQNVGNLVSTPQQLVYVEDTYVRIVPANPDIIYVPTYDPSLIFYTPGFSSYVSFGFGFPCGVWFDLDLDWRNHWAYRPGWTWNHWHDNFIIDRDHFIRPRHDFEPHRIVGAERPTTVWHRDNARPLTFPGRRLSRPSDFDRFRGREHDGNRRTPETIHNPVGIDRGRATQSHPTPPIFQNPRATPSRPTDQQHGGARGNDRPTNTPRPATPNPRPAPRAPEPGPSRVTRPAESPHPAPANPAPARPSTPAPSRPTTPAPSAPAPRAAPPAHVATPPVRISAPPPARPSTPAYVQPPRNDSKGGQGGGDRGRGGHK